VGTVQRQRFCRHELHRRCRAKRAVRAVGRDDPQLRTDAQPGHLCRAGKAERGGRAPHLPIRRSPPGQRHRESRHGSIRRDELRTHRAAGGQTMNLLGKLSWSAVPYDQPIIMLATGLMVVSVVGVLGWVTLKGYVPYLWREWITSVDHKRIGVMYIVL